MTVNLSALAPLTAAAQSLSSLILVSPQSVTGYQAQNADGSLGGANANVSFVFAYEGENTATFETDSTDHYVEDNTARQDQMALKPLRYSCHGFIGELNDIPPAALAIVKTAADKLTSVGSYAPTLSATALLAYSEAFFLYQTAASAADSAVQTWDSASNYLSGSGSMNVINSQGQLQLTDSYQTLQQQRFALLFGYWSRKTLFTIQTPWAIFQNMAMSFRAIQEDGSNVITDFELTFKQIRIASTDETGGFSGTPAYLQARTQSQYATPEDNGTTSPSSGPSLDSVLSGVP